MPYPKIELHVHLEGTLRPERLLDIARRNGYPLPVDTVEGVRGLYEYRDFDHFIEVWIVVTNALRHGDDFRQLVVDYAGEAARHGAVYVEGIFSPIERVWRGVEWDEIFTGYCDGAQEARERHGVEVRLTPDITRDSPLEDAMTAVRYAIEYRDRGIVGIGLGGEETLYPPEPFEPAFRAARDGGLGSVPHAGEVVGPRSIWGALETLGADRIRHGIRAEEDPALVREIADLTREYAVATSFGIAPRLFYEAGVAGALCDRETKERLDAMGRAYPWPDRPDRPDRPHADGS